MADDKMKPVQNALVEAMKELISPSNMRKYGEQAAAMIKLRTRLGHGVDSDGAEKERLKPLSDGYREQRKKLRKKGKLSDQTSPGKSNLTSTGQMLDSIGITHVEPGGVVVSPKGRRDDGLNNEDVAAFVTIADRPFNNLSRIEVKRVNDALKKDLKELIKAKLTKTK